MTEAHPDASRYARAASARTVAVLGAGLDRHVLGDAVRRARPGGPHLGPAGHRRRAAAIVVTSAPATLPGGARDPEELLGADRDRRRRRERRARTPTSCRRTARSGSTLKRELFATVEAAVDERRADPLVDVSGIMPSDLAREIAHPGRLLVGHPFNPPARAPARRGGAGRADRPGGGRGGGRVLRRTRQVAGPCCTRRSRLRRQPAAVGACSRSRCTWCREGVVIAGGAGPHRHRVARRPVGDGRTVPEHAPRRRARRAAAHARAPRPGDAAALEGRSGSPS